MKKQKRSLFLLLALLVIGLGSFAASAQAQRSKTYRPTSTVRPAAKKTPVKKRAYRAPTVSQKAYLELKAEKDRLAADNLALRKEKLDRDIADAQEELDVLKAELAAKVTDLEAKLGELKRQRAVLDPPKKRGVKKP